MQEYFCNLVTTEKCLRYFLPKLINNLSDDFTFLFSIINTHTFKFKLKTHLLISYDDSDCCIPNCYPCMRKLFALTISNLSKLMSYISIFAYVENLAFIL